MIRNEALNYLRGLLLRRTATKKPLNSEQEESLWDTIIEQEANQLLQTAIATLPRNAN